MAVVPLKEILDRAFADRYGVAAFNVVNDLTLDAVVAAAEELRSPLIVQTSVKTVKSIGARLLLRHVRRHRRARDGARDAAPRPLPRPRGRHDLPRDRVELGAVRRLGAARRREHPPDRRGGRRGPPPRGARRGRDRGRPRRRGRRRLRRGGRDLPASTRPWRSSRPPGVDCFAPAIGTAHGVYAAAPELNPQRVTDLVARVPIPMVLHGGTGLSEEAFRDLIAARLRQGEHLDGAEGHLPRLDAGPSSTRTRPSTTRRRSSATSAPPSRRWPSGTSRCSAARARPGERPDLRLRRRARRHRAGRAPAGLQPDVRGVRPPGALVRGGVRGEAAHRRRQGAHGEPAQPRVRRARRACPPTPRASASAVAEWHARKTAIYTDLVAAGALPARPGVARAHRRGARRRLDARGGVDLGRGVGARGARARGRRPDRAARFAVVLAGDVVPRKKPAPDIYELALERLGRAGRRRRW